MKAVVTDLLHYVAPLRQMMIYLPLVADLYFANMVSAILMIGFMVQTYTIGFVIM